ncbi:unnamed protein product, partial [Staurois parvus]
GSVANGQTVAAEEWSGIAEVRTGGVRSESGSKQNQDQAGSRQDAGTGAHGKHTPRHLSQAWSCLNTPSAISLR